MATKQRDLNFELLRVLSIISIVFGHLSRIGPDIINPFALLGDVNCFVLISGYFMVCGKFKAIRFVRLAIETVFYCFIISLLFGIFSYLHYIYDGFNFNVGVADLVKSAFPFGPHSYSYWFINKFLALLLLQPVLSLLVKHLTRKQYKYLLIVLLLLNTTFVSFFPFATLFDNGWSLPWFVTLFLIGGYVRLYKPFSNVHNWWLYWLISGVIMILAYRYMYNWFKVDYNQWFFFFKSFSLFMFIRQISISPKSVLGKITKFIAPNVLSIYLIHNQFQMIKFLKLIGTYFSMSESVVFHFVKYVLFCSLVVVACVLIDKLRIWIFNKIKFTSFLNKISERWDKSLCWNEDATSDDSEVARP